MLLDKISEDNKIILYKIFGQEKLEELTEKEANDILIRASPSDLQNTVLNKSVNTVRKYDAFNVYLNYNINIYCVHCFR